MAIELSETIRQEVKVYLNELRRSGVTNMYGAAPYVENEFDMDKQTARKYVVDWMGNFKPEDR